MLSVTVMRRLEALRDISKQGKRINGLFRLMEDQILWYEAYANIYSNKGAMTKGVNEVTLDGFSEQRVASIIKRLKEGTYRFQPVRRVLIPKKNGKKRPLGISSGDDKLVQEGSIVSPILANAYLHELDLFIKELRHASNSAQTDVTILSLSDQRTVKLI